MHVDRIGQLGLAFSQRTKLDRFVCVWTAGASWTSCGIGHSADHTGTGDRGLNSAASNDSTSVEVAMRILMVASEAAPFAKTGDLADVVAVLPPALAQLGHSVDVVIPRYRGIAAGELVARVDRAPLAARSRMRPSTRLPKAACARSSLAMRDTLTATTSTARSVTTTRTILSALRFCRLPRSNGPRAPVSGTT